ncbi:MAG: winged helix-turn-helix transcriptional regulator, partial [Pseudomonas sp.]
MAKNDFALDRVDKRIIEALQHNARMTNRELAELVHMSPSASLKRTKRLEEQGYISHYTLALNLDNICQNIQVLAQIKLNSLQGMVSALRLEARIKQIPFAT